MSMVFSSFADEPDEDLKSALLQRAAQGYCCQPRDSRAEDLKYALDCIDKMNLRIEELERRLGVIKGPVECAVVQPMSWILPSPLSPEWDEAVLKLIEEGERIRARAKP